MGSSIVDVKHSGWIPHWINSARHLMLVGRTHRSAARINVVYMQEHRYNHSEGEIEYNDAGNRWTFVSTSAWRNSINAIIGGIGMLLRPCAQKSLIRIEKIQPMSNGNPCTTIISCYSPTNASDEKDIDIFYNELSFLICSIPKYNVLIIGGDMNVQIGKNENNEFSLHSLSKRNEEHLMDFSKENGLTCLNTKWKENYGLTRIKIKIDYILMNKT